MAINIVTDLKDYLFGFLKKDEKIIFENNYRTFDLASLGKLTLAA